jgi:hypothetical protein
MYADIFQHVQKIYSQYNVQHKWLTFALDNLKHALSKTSDV